MATSISSYYLSFKLIQPGQPGQTQLVSALQLSDLETAAMPTQSAHCLDIDILQGDRPEASDLASGTGGVMAVTGGDTPLDQVQHKVRLTGIDAPERGQPFGTVSRDHLASLVASKEVLVESIKSDRYSRLLGKGRVQRQTAQPVASPLMPIMPSYLAVSVPHQRAVT